MINIFINMHLGAGDAIICNGIVSVLSYSFHVIIPCWKHNLETIEKLYQENQRVSVIPFELMDDIKPVKYRFNYKLDIGYEGFGFEKDKFDRSFYEQAGMPFEYRWSEFRLPESVLPKCDTDYSDTAFVHEDLSRGMKIDPRHIQKDLQVFSMPKIEGKTIFDYLPILQNAKELHLISSCMALLADSVPLKAERKVIHAYARPGEALPTFKQNWEIIL